MTTEKARYFAWFWGILWLLATVVLVLEVLAAVPVIRFIVTLALVVVSAWRAAVYWRRSVAPDGDPAGDPDQAPAQDRMPAPPPGSSFTERMDWIQQQPHFRRVWTYCLLMSVLLTAAAAGCIIAALTSSGRGGILALGIIWILPAAFFSSITWRTRGGLAQRRSEPGQDPGDGPGR